MNLNTLLKMLTMAVLLSSKIHSAEDHKQHIQQLESQISRVPIEQRGALIAQMASAYYKDQQPEKAFITFLEALEKTSCIVHAVDVQDVNLYEQVLKVYLGDKSSQEIADAILKAYEEISKVHPTYFQLGYLISIAYANLDHFPLFFEKFYRSYQSDPQHYLAYKTKAVLYIKLLSKGRTPAQKERWRDEVISNLKQAFDLYPQDPSLCKMLVVFAAEEQKKEILISCLNKILISNTMIPRKDIAVYVRQAVVYKQKELAQRLVNKAREWYSYSRTVEEAQHIIDEND